MLGIHVYKVKHFDTICACQFELVPICSSLFCGVSVAMVSAGASGVPKVDKKEQGVEGNVLEKPVSI